MRRNTLPDIDDDDDDDKTWATGSYKITQGLSLFAIPVGRVLVIFLRPMKLKIGKFVK